MSPIGSYTPKRLARLLIFLGVYSTDEVEKAVVEDFPDVDRAYLSDVITRAVAERERDEARLDGELKLLNPNPQED